ncbi:solute carrier family 43 member 3 isoform X2 [Bufo gargarizans]|uniref:solute carrier family 43 member 3 isoform X2 n=1 Tax=Bufo gargarizans TaxID=30331 RepID=UPI001CF588A8|nr:solute carrier family 43 member 3 isoform X2 [Bufo gargarizans]
MLWRDLQETTTIQLGQQEEKTTDFETEMRFQYVLTLITGLIECICFAGVTFGWASLVFVLKKENYFNDLCPDTKNQSTNATGGCPSQDEHFSLIFTVAAFMNSAMTFPGGYIFDRFGTAVTRFIAICLFTTATLLIALSTADTAVLIFPALSLLASGGIFLILTNMQVGNLFGPHRSTIITLYNGAFDSSSVIFLVVKVLYENGISLQNVFLFISSCSICHVLRTIFLMPKNHIPFPVPEGYRYGLGCEELSQKISMSPNHSSRPIDGEKGQKTTNTSIKRVEKHDIEVSFRNCVLSSLFGWHLIWLSLMQLRHYLFIATLNPTITRLSGGDPHLVSKYTNVFAISQFFGVFCAPWNGLIMDRHKKKHKVTEPLDDLRSSVLSLLLTTIQCILFSLCASISELPALYPTFIFQVLNRSFLYGGNAAFLSIAFPPAHFGKLYGLVMTLSAVVSLLQYPAIYIIGTYLHGDAFYVNISLLILMLLTVGHPINVFRVWRQKKHLKDKAEAQSWL